MPLAPDFMADGKTSEELLDTGSQLADHAPTLTRTIRYTLCDAKTPSDRSPDHDHLDELHDAETQSDDGCTAYGQGLD